jgi:hypothetical protein
MFPRPHAIAELDQALLKAFSVSRDNVKSLEHLEAKARR